MQYDYMMLIVEEDVYEQGTCISDDVHGAIDYAIRKHSDLLDEDVAECYNQPEVSVRVVNGIVTNSAVGVVELEGEVVVTVTVRRSIR